MRARFDLRPAFPPDNLHELDIACLAQRLNDATPKQVTELANPDDWVTCVRTPMVHLICDTSRASRLACPSRLPCGLVPPSRMLCGSTRQAARRHLASFRYTGLV